MYQTLTYDVRDKIAYVTVSRPEVLNALNTETLRELFEVFQEIQNDPDVQCVILTGSGRAFVAGADIANMYQLNLADGRAMQQQGHNLMNFMEKIEKPIIAAINGYALGGGCELAMACDIRIASKKARLGLPETNIGVFPCFGGTYRLPHLVGMGIAKYLIYTGEHIPAEEAWRLGLVDILAEPDELMEKAGSIAQKIIKHSAVTIGAAKTAINNGYSVDVNTASTIAVEAFSLAFASEDRKEGMKAFLEKREPHFSNR